MKVKPMLINIPDEEIEDLRKGTAISCRLRKLIKGIIVFLGLFFVNYLLNN